MRGSEQSVIKRNISAKSTRQNWRKSVVSLPQRRYAPVAQLDRALPPEAEVSGSNPVGRAIKFVRRSCGGNITA